MHQQVATRLHNRVVLLFFAYSTNYLIDVDAGIIMDVEPTPGYRTAEVDSTKTMVDRLRFRGMSGAHDEFLLAATAQNLRRMAQWLWADPPNSNVSVA